MGQVEEGMEECPPGGGGDGGGAAERKPLMDRARYRILHFTPSWFSVNMGTGITSILLYNLPYQFNGLQVIAECIFGLNVVLFLLFTVVSVLRYMLFPDVWRLMLFHSQQSLFLGTFPMGMATIVNMMVYVIVPHGGQGWVYAVFALWIVNVVISWGTTIGMPFVIFTIHDLKMDNLSAALLLPIVPCVVAASTGAIVASVLPPGFALPTVLLSYFTLGCGILPTIFFMSIYVLRLSVFKLPPASMIVSTFLPLGPCGQGAYAVLELSKVLYTQSTNNKMNLVPSDRTLSLQAASAIYAGGIITSLFLLGLGFWWLMLALLSIAYSRAQMSFNLGWWAFTFPLGVFASGVVQLGRELESEAVLIVGTVCSLAEVALWMYITIKTMVKYLDGSTFLSPCVIEAGVQEQYARPRQ